MLFMKYPIQIIFMAFSFFIPLSLITIFLQNIYNVINFKILFLKKSFNKYFINYTSYISAFSVVLNLNLIFL